MKTSEVILAYEVLGKNTEGSITIKENVMKGGPTSLVCASSE